MDKSAILTLPEEEYDRILKQLPLNLLETEQNKQFQIADQVSHARIYLVITAAIFSLIFSFYLGYTFLGPQVVKKQTQGTVLSAYTKVDDIQKTGRSVPVRLQIPSIDVDAEIEYMGINKKGEMEVPNDTVNVGWYKFGPTPGENGSAVISGHFDGRKGKHGVFDNLDKLKLGDKISVTNELGIITTFVVRGSRIYIPGFAKEVFFATDGGKHLNLVTCDGAWDATKKSFAKRLVVFADSDTIH